MRKYCAASFSASVKALFVREICAGLKYITLHGKVKKSLRKTATKTKLKYIPSFVYVNTLWKYNFQELFLPVLPHGECTGFPLLEDIIVIKYSKFKYLQVRREDEAKNHKKKLLQNP
jgi:hypothetical protein